MDGSPGRSSAELRLLGDAVDVAFAVARRDARDRSAPAPPVPLRPLLSFRVLPSAARSTVLDVLDEDEAFRDRVVGAAGDLGEMGAPSELFLSRPPGWAEELRLMVSAAQEEERRAAAERDEVAAARRVEQLDAAVGRLRRDLADAGEDVARLTAELQSESSRSRESAQAEARARQDAERLSRERDAAVRELEQARALAAERLANQRAAEQEAEAARAEVAPAGVPVDAVAELARRLDELGRQVGSVAQELAGLVASVERTIGPGAGTGDVRPAIGRSGPEQGDGGDRARRRRRRRPRTQLVHGALDGTAEAARQYLSAPGAVAVVDGYNVSMAAWPSLDASAQRDSLLSCLADLRNRTGADLHVVFDGDDDGRRPSVSAPLAVRIHFSPAEREADDVVLDLVERVDPDRPVVVVSSDRRVREGARERGASVVAAADLLALWRQ